MPDTTTTTAARKARARLVALLRFEGERDFPTVPFATGVVHGPRPALTPREAELVREHGFTADRARRHYIGNCSGPESARTVPFDTGTVHGPELPGKNPSSPFYRFARDCACGAVETGFPHSWHAQDCVRWGRA